MKEALISSTDDIKMSFCLFFLQQVEHTEAPDKDTEQQISDSPDDATISDSVPEIKETSGHEEVKDGGPETSSKFFCYICNITCHNQQVCIMKNHS